MKNNTSYDLVSYEEASPEVQVIYDDTMKTLQLPFVLNWFKCQGNNAILLEGNWSKLKNTLMRGIVPNVLKQLIIYNVSRLRGCDYCARAHGIFANNMKAEISDDPSYQATDLQSPHLPKSYKSAIEVITEAALRPQGISDEHYHELYAAGFSAAEVQELMAQADLVNMLNTLADLSNIQLDNELAEAVV